MRAVDTNVLVRLLVQDDQAQVGRCDSGRDVVGARTSELGGERCGGRGGTVVLGESRLWVLGLPDHAKLGRLDGALRI